MNFLLPIDTSKNEHTGHENCCITSEIEDDEWRCAVPFNSVAFEVKDVEE